ncbi:hypothetical protein [Roseburia sp. AF20-18LB]|uniref:hypothetical protein n=1 Tax=Roseburia sp. AF20-18LB TaxID=2293129 RepID=UPI000E51AE02|nr:hypothetical protein [Roseburia sp. AF20-18LB]RGG49843.1 hypothetical protein DWX65_05415 [Roseburia sp. AF20-18LB]
MGWNIGSTAFFVAAVILVWSSIFGLYKSEEKQTGVTWIVMLLILLNCYHTFWAAVLDLVHIPINIISIGIIDMITGGIVWFFNWKKKKYQKYEFAVSDLMFVVTAVVVLIIFAKTRYGGTALNLNFLTIDPANHFRAAMDLVNDGTVTSMFYETVWNGLFIEMLAPLATVDYYYRFYVLSELIQVCLSAFVFYGIARKYGKDRFGRVAAYILSFVYMIGYPMCSMIYGFTYLGMGVTVVGMLIILTDMYLKENMGKWMNIIFLMLGCLAIFECYVMFMPVTFFALITCIFVKQWKMHKLVSQDTVVTCLAVFLIPCILGFVYTYAGVFKDGVTVSSAIVNEGACYRDLFSNFVIYIPLILFGFYAMCKKGDNNLVLFLAPYTFVFTLLLLWKTVTGKASTYYFYKIYFLLWLIAFVLVFYGVVYAQKQTRVLITGYFITWIFLVGMYLGKVEERIQIHNSLMVSSYKAEAYNDLLHYNYITFWMPGYSKEKEELYHWVYNELLEQGEELVPMAGYWEDDLWYQAITNQRYYGWGQSDPNHTDYFNHLNDSGAEYILVLKDSQIYQDEQAYFDSLERIYDTEIGFVGKLNEK